MRTHKSTEFRPRQRSLGAPLRASIIVELFVAAALQLSTGTAIAADQFIRPITLDIPANTLLEDALIEWGRQAGMAIMIDTRSIAGQVSARVQGTFSSGDALQMLLRNSGLTYTKEGQIVHIVPTNKKIRFEDDSADSVELPSANSDFDRRLSRVNLDENEPNGSGDSEGNNRDHLTEVLITARKTGEAERLQDVPVPISVISAQALMQTNQAQIQDYFNQIPGLSVLQAGDGLSVVSIRGITTGQNTNPTVGFTLDDVPLGASTLSGANGQVPIINPADLAQVEVLRGPQGTLYGDNSMGGLIRYVTVDPSTDRIFGDVRVGGDKTINGAHLGYNINAAVNLPVTDTLAIRASAFTRLDPGYVDDVQTGQHGVNDTKSGGGRLAAKWSPSSDFSMKFSVLYEKTDTYGSDDVDVPTAGIPQTLSLGDLQQYTMRGTGFYDEEFKTGSLTLTANLPGVKLTSMTGYTVNEYITSYDFSWAFAPPPSTTGTPLIISSEVHKFTQELRLTGSIGSSLDWLLGGFYTLEDTRYFEYLSTVDLASGAVVGGVPGDIYYSNEPGRYREYAGFASATWSLTDQFDVQFGGRESYMETPSLAEGSYSGGSLIDEPAGPSTYAPPSSSYWKANAFTYLVSPRFKLSPDFMVYARVADGFRPGSGTSNPPPTASCVEQNIPCLIHPDKTTDYEIGAKADFFDHTLSLDSSVYYIKWKGLQVNLITPNYINYSGNGAGAKSQGVDLSLTWKPLETMTVSGWGAWNEAQVTETFANAAAGQPLPYSARFSANLSVEKDVRITSGTRAFFSGTEIYIGERTGEFTALASPRQELPAYSQTNLNAGIKTAPWTFNLYVNNVTDRRGLLYGGLGSNNAPFAFNFIRPRTIGISVERAL